MSSYRYQTPHLITRNKSNRQCIATSKLPKIKYASRDDAMTAWSGAGDRGRLVPYRCDRCGLWHVGTLKLKGFRT